MPQIKTGPTCSTGQAAAILRVSKQSVIRWCDRGWIASRRLHPESRYRAVYVDDLPRFARLSMRATRTTSEEIAAAVAELKAGLPRAYKDTRREVFTTGQAARVLRISLRSVCRLCDEGWIASYRVFDHRRITREALEQYVAVHGGPNLEIMQASSA